jgi:hypothetical protein
VGSPIFGKFLSVKGKHGTRRGAAIGALGGGHVDGGGPAAVVRRRG